jgi:hypothetical protein
LLKGSTVASLDEGLEEMLTLHRLALSNGRIHRKAVDGSDTQSMRVLASRESRPSLPSTWVSRVSRDDVTNAVFEGGCPPLALVGASMHKRLQDN